MLRQIFNLNQLNPWARSTSNPNKITTTKEKVKKVKKVEDVYVKLEQGLLDPTDIKKDTEHENESIVYFLVSGLVYKIDIDKLDGTKSYSVMVDKMDNIDYINPRYYTFYRDEIITNSEYEHFLNTGKIFFSIEIPALKDTVYFVKQGYVSYISIDESNNRNIYQVSVGSDLKYFYGNQLMTEDEYFDKFVNINRGILKRNKVGGSRRSRRHKYRSRRHKKSTCRHRKH
jgi:hypothetical protein